MASYNEIIKIFSDYSTANFVIKSFGNGEPWELVETFKQKDAEYPKMWLEDMPNATALGEDVFKFRVYMLGQVATLKEKTETTLGEDNTNEVKSNMRQNCLDLLSYLVQQTNFPEISTDKNITLTSFVDKFNDKLTGWYFDLNVRQAFRFNACIIPMEDIPPPPVVGCDDATITINSDAFGTVPSGATENIIVKDDLGVVVGSLIGGEWIVPAGGACADGTVVIKNENDDILHTVPVASGGSVDQEIADTQVTSSGGAYDVAVFAEGSLVLPDVTNTDSDGSPVITEAQVPFVCTPAVTPTNSAPVMKSGQVTPFFANDDGTDQDGRATDFFTLDHLNGFGLTNDRITDTLGTQLYANDIVVDWGSLASDGTGGIIMYHRTVQPATSTVIVTTNEPYILDGFTDWKLPNVKQMFNVLNAEYMNSGRFDWFDYAPFNISFSTTAGLATKTVGRFSDHITRFVLGSMSSTNANTATPYILCRLGNISDLGL